MPASRPADPVDVDVLVVGAGPTGLALAVQLAAFGVSFRVVDAAADGARESRALAIQARTLEVLAPFGVSAELVRRGNPTARLHLHAGARVWRTQLFDIGARDTAYPFLLFLSQAVTEQVLVSHLARRGVRVERDATVLSLDDDGHRVRCRVAHPGGDVREVTARYVVGCDGAHSTVRTLSGTPFEGGVYPQTFLLGDVSADAPDLEPDSVHAFLTPSGPLLLFPLREPAPWRLITGRPPGSPPGPATLAELQELCDRGTRTGSGTGTAIGLRDPVWLNAFTLHHRHAGRYRTGRAFLAGDAAHVHSPAGAQGMNTGIQDALNLGWKLALVVRGDAAPELLDSYDAERRPVGAFVVRFTDRAFTAVTSAHPVARLARTHVAPRLLPAVLRFRPGRRVAFRTVSQLGIHYRHSPAVEASPPARSPLLGLRRARPQAGDRLPDAEVTLDGRPARLHDVLTAASYHLLLVGPPTAWDAAAVRDLQGRFPQLLDVHRVAGRGPVQLLVRPDGHVAYRADGSDLAGADRHLSRWLRAAGAGQGATATATATAKPPQASL